MLVPRSFSEVGLLPAREEDIEKRSAAQLAGTRGEGFAEVFPEDRHLRPILREPESALAVKGCIFCEVFREHKRPVLETEHFFAMLDISPVNTGHLLLIPKRHVPDFWGLNTGEWEDLPVITRRSKNYLDEVYHPDGCNIGINCGEAAGQTVFHCHIPLIPRFKGEERLLNG